MNLLTEIAVGDAHGALKGGRPPYRSNACLTASLKLLSRTRASVSAPIGVGSAMKACSWYTDPILFPLDHVKALARKAATRCDSGLLLHALATSHD